MSQFFIDRPVFAWVIAIFLMVAGVLAIHALPIEQYPQIAPPSVSITAFYPGASAQTVEKTVTQVIEQKMNGLDYLRYMSSFSDSTGNVTITLTFDAKANPDIAQVQVQNKLQLAMPLLPQAVQSQGLKVQKAAKNYLLVVGLLSEDGKYSSDELSDLLISKVQDPISRTSGVGDVLVYGAQHSMRIWLDPDKLISYGIATTDVVSAIEAENAEVSVGQIGGAPYVKGQQLNASIIAQSRLSTPDQFEKILVRVNTNGSQIRLKDIARVELGAENYDVLPRYNGHPTSGLAIKLAAGSNALDTVDSVKKEMNNLKQFLPEDIKVIYPYDTTPFVRLSIHEVVKTLAEAIGLVFLVMFLFLQNWRATLVPTIAIPVVLLGTFALLEAFGFSINTLTMFAMVLAIGLLVDDAIVVVENVERVMSEQNLSPREATRLSMKQISRALVGIALVLSAVFLPMAFMGGSTGVIYRQFSITIVSAMVLSVLVAMILTPALCVSLLRPSAINQENTHPFFRRFNSSFEKVRALFLATTENILGKKKRSFIAYGLMIVVIAGLFMRLPTSFLPDEDQGLMTIQIQTPVGASRERTSEVLQEVSDYLRKNEPDTVDTIFTLAGFNFAGRGQNAGMIFVKLKDWDVRPEARQKVGHIIERIMQGTASIKDGTVIAFAPPAVIELGNASGFDIELQDRGNLGHDVLMKAMGQFLGEAAKNPSLMAVRPNGLNDTPQFNITVDREKAEVLGLSLSDINTTLSAAWGSSYVNDFIDDGRVKKVYIQADAPYRMMPEDLNRWEIRNSAGQMVPLKTITSTNWSFGSPQLERYNGISSREILGAPAPGQSTGEAMQAVEQIVSHLPKGIGYEWTGLSYEERLAGSQTGLLYALSILVVFLCLSALYESWSIPLGVIMFVPFGIIGSAIAVSLLGLSNDVYFQVGLLTTVGLATKNAILIVEFAKELHDKGMKAKDAAISAAKTRLRPIIMTSLAIILGVLPLAISNGAGSGAQNAIGTGVIGGMISATIFAVTIPLFFVFVQDHMGRKAKLNGLTEDGVAPAYSETSETK